MLTLRDIRSHVGQFLIAGFDGHEISSELRSIARQFDLGGVILFDRNVEEPDQVAEISRGAQALASDQPLWVSVDQEGGRVARLRAPFTEWPPAVTLGRCGDVVLAERFGRALAVELRAVGISLDFAPVLDVHTNPANPVSGDRALATRADRVGDLGTAIIRGLQASGVAACGKHFPGHGDTASDSHLELPVVDHSPERLREVELVPFRAAIRAGVASIMTAHLLVPALDETRPATMSPAIVTDLLRTELGYGGLVVSDDLEMRAIAEHYTKPEAAVAAVAAGCDVVLLCSGDHDGQVAALEALVHAVEQELLPRQRIADAFARQRQAKERFLVPPPAPLTERGIRSVLGRDEHVAVAEQMEKFR